MGIPSQPTFGIETETSSKLWEIRANSQWQLVRVLLANIFAEFPSQEGADIDFHVLRAWNYNFLQLRTANSLSCIYNFYFTSPYLTYFWLKDFLRFSHRPTFTWRVRLQSSTKHLRQPKKVRTLFKCLVPMLKASGKLMEYHLSGLEGGPVQILCKSFSIPPPDTISWFLNSGREEINPSINQTKSYQTNSNQIKPHQTCMWAWHKWE